MECRDKGSGIHKNIMDGYRYIVQNYSPGDELFLFGFSRGAYTVRSLCGLINNCGILKRPDARLIQTAFDHYKRQEDEYAPEGTKSIAFRKRHAHPSKEVRFLCVFDTVGALGIPFSWLGWLNAEDDFMIQKWAQMCALPATLSLLTSDATTLKQSFYNPEETWI